MTTQFSDIVMTPVLGPLSTSNYPSTIPYHSYGSLPGRHPNPPLFYPSQEPVYADQNTNSRQHFLRCARRTNSLYEQRGPYRERDIKLLSRHESEFFNYSDGFVSGTSNRMNYIVPIQSSMYTTIRKADAVGKSGFKLGLPDAALYSTKNYFPSSTYTTLRKARSGGCTAPKKKGSIFNYSLKNGQVCAWGSFPRQNY